MRSARAASRDSVAGFSLTELAIVFTIVAFLLASAMFTLSAQIEQRNFEETRRRLDQARELVLAFALLNGRLPCPARSNSLGAEVRVPDLPLVANSGKCQDAGANEDYYGGTGGVLGAGVTGGLLPAQSIGFQQVDAAGFAVDAWGNRIRYAVAKTVSNCSVPVPALPHFTYYTNLKANGINCYSNDLSVCKSATAAPAPTATPLPPSCGGGGANQIMTNGLVAAIIFSTGKNTTTSGGTSADEATNLKTNGALNPLVNALFVFHTPTTTDSVGGEFDDQFTWITVGEFYGKLVAAGTLP